MDLNLDRIRKCGGSIIRISLGMESFRQVVINRNNDKIVLEIPEGKIICVDRCSYTFADGQVWSQEYPDNFKKSYTYAMYQDGDWVSVGIDAEKYFRKISDLIVHT